MSPGYSSFKDPSRYPVGVVSPSHLGFRSTVVRWQIRAVFGWPILQTKAAGEVLYSNGAEGSRFVHAAGRSKDDLLFYSFKVVIFFLV